MRLREAHFGELDVATLYEILRLRVDVFVVEQDCAYDDLDGRDREEGTRHVWLEDERGVASYLRILVDDGASRLGRIVTRPDARSQGLAARLVEHGVATSPGPWVMAAQAHLADFYGGLGFLPVSGEVYDDDGILHLDLCRAPA